MSDDTARENAHEAASEPTEPQPPADDIAAALLERFAGSVFNDSHGQPVVYVDRAVWHDVALFLRDEQQFTMCLDVTAVDHLLDGVRYCPAAVEAERFELVSNFLSHTRNRRIRVIAEVPAADPSIASIIDVYPGMAFAEREVFDMFGITFEGHADLSRILMPDDWDGHPLRKDYPTARVPVTFKGDPSPR
ncbi:MAG: NADH-quinone oxidoreductase subunit [Actinomycetota bacterium]|jgi:NADH:ubiquinone oxidoreductase subunit C|nr:NADH-quinone oxidoreductase subunit [Actinomycetota bacterium]